MLPWSRKHPPAPYRESAPAEEFSLSLLANGAKIYKTVIAEEGGTVVTSKNQLLTGFFVLIAFTIIACGGGGEAGPAVGSPEWLWDAAAANNVKGDFEKTQEHLGKVVGSQNPWQDRARVWRFVLLNGLAAGYAELGEAYAKGAKEDAAGGAEFMNSVQQYRRDARRHTIALAEGLGDWRKQVGSVNTLSIDFPLPAGSGNQSPILASISEGVAPNNSQAESAQSQTVQRSILLSAAAAAGMGDDIAKARNAFQATPIEVEATPFFLAVAQAVVYRSKLFGRDHLMEPAKEVFMLDMAAAFAAPAAQGEDDELKGQAEELLEAIEDAKKPPNPKGRR